MEAAIKHLAWINSPEGKLSHVKAAELRGAGSCRTDNKQIYNLFVVGRELKRFSAPRVAVCQVPSGQRFLQRRSNSVC